MLTAYDSHYQSECSGFNLSEVPQPDLVVGATCAADVVAAVRHAAERRLPVGVQATGHGPGRPMREGLLISTKRLTQVRVDPGSATARVAAGATWEKVVDAAAPYGLAPLCGAAPGVGAVSYTLDGGLGPLGRAYGFAADHVNRLEVVTADGHARVVTADRHPDLFWAMRGGGGNFGVVTALEIALFPVARLYGGALSFAGRDVEQVLAAFADCADTAPRQLSLSIALLTFPDLPVVPPSLRGEFCAQVRVAYLGEVDDGEALIAPLRSGPAPLLDTVRMMPFTQIGTIHGDPVLPRPVNSNGTTLTSLPEAAVQRVLDTAGPAAPFMIELRHLGGVHDVAEGGNAVGHRAAAFNVFTSAYPGPSIELAALVQPQFLDRLRPWGDGGPLLNFQSAAEYTAADAATAYEPAILDRLSAVKRTWDGANVFRYTHNLPV